MPCRDPRHQSFCEHYAATLDRTGSAVAARFAVVRARRTAHVLMQREDVKAEIKRLIDRRAAETRVKAHLILEELAVVALSDRSHYMLEDGELALAPGAPADAMRAVSSVEYETKTNRTTGTSTTKVKFRLWDKNTALTNAMKHLGIISDKLEVHDSTLEDLIRDAAGGDDAGDA